MEENVSYKFYWIALFFVLLGVGIIYCSTISYFEQHKEWQTVIQNIGGSIIASVGLAVLWELRGKREFLKEILQKVHISNNLNSEGIAKVYSDIYNISSDEWKEYSEKAQNIDLMFAYGNLWRNANRHFIKEIADKRKLKIRVIFVDPEDINAVNQLAKNFGKTTESIKNKLLESLNFFEDLSTHRNIDIEIYLLKGVPGFQVYRFDEKMIFGTYSGLNIRPETPGIVCTDGGNLFNFYSNEFEFMSKNGCRVLSPPVVVN